MTVKEKFENLKRRVIEEYESIANDYVKKWGTYLDAAIYDSTPDGVSSWHRPIHVLIRNATSETAQEYYVKSVNVSLDASQITINEYWRTPKGRKVEILDNSSCAIIPLDYNLGGIWAITNAMKAKMGIITDSERSYLRFEEYIHLTSLVGGKMALIAEHYGHNRYELILDSPIVFHTGFNEKLHRYHCSAIKYIEVLSDGDVYFYWDKEKMDAKDHNYRYPVNLFEFNLLSYIELEGALLKKLRDK